MLISSMHISPVLQVIVLSSKRASVVFLSRQGLQWHSIFPFLIENEISDKTSLSVDIIGYRNIFEPNLSSRMPFFIGRSCCPSYSSVQAWLKRLTACSTGISRGFFRVGVQGWLAREPETHSPPAPQPVVSGPALPGTSASGGKPGWRMQPVSPRGKQASLPGCLRFHGLSRQGKHRAVMAHF
jgi:hypothetical protein